VSPGGAGGPVAFVGDSHLLAGDEATPAFVRFVAASVGRFERLVLVGDVFDLWIARGRLHEEHHRRALEAIREARARGLAVDYAVGNRDYGVETLPDAPFDRIATETLRDPSATPAWVAEHGDLVNADDLQYRRWRAFSRSAPVLGTFLALPAAVSVPLSQWLERRMRTTNLDHKRAFPTGHALRRARFHFEESGARYLVLGHFHQELRLDAAPGEVLVLPDWKRARRHAEWHPNATSGTMKLADSVA
jgi:UDP-2,3-diacylglucosamine pyrophosphatase LpxH